MYSRLFRIDGREVNLRFHRQRDNDIDIWIETGNICQHRLPRLLAVGEKFRTGGHTYEVLS